MPELEDRRRPGAEVAHRLVPGFPGSPTVLIDGHDPFASGDELSSIRTHVTGLSQIAEGAVVDMEITTVIPRSGGADT